MRRTMSPVIVLGCGIPLVLAGIASVLVGSYFVREARRNAMVEAVSKGDLASVKAMVGRRPSLVNAEYRDRLGMFPMPVLTVAIRDRHKDVAEFLIFKGANVNGGLSCDPKAVHFAAEWGDADIIRLLLSKGADPNDDGWGSAPIVWAVAAGNRDAVAILKSHGARPVPRIHEAAGLGDLQAVRQELERDPEAVDRKECEYRPMDLAASNGHAEVVDLLIAYGAKIEPYTLLSAAGSGHLGTVKVLVEHGADVNAVEEDGDDTALQGAAEAGQIKVVSYLLAHGADPSIEANGYTAAELAEDEGHKEVARLLRKHKQSSTTE